MKQDQIERIQNGDQAAFLEVVHTYEAYVRGVIGCMGVSRPDADDIAQDVFLHVYQHVHDFQPGTNFHGWIAALARMRVLTYFKSVKRAKERREKLQIDYLQDRTFRVEDEFEVDMLDRLEACVSALSSDLQGIVQARYSGQSLEEISLQTGRSVDSIKGLLKRVRKLLKRCIEEQYEQAD